MNLIEVEDVAKSFRVPTVRRDTVREHLLGLFAPRGFRRLEVLRSVSLEVSRGESVAVLGRNGSGKSTLLKLLCGIYQPDRGRIVVRAPLTPILELGIGWNPELDALDNILLLGTVMGMNLREAEAATGSILAFAELEPFARLELKHYSSGMAARLAYAVAFEAVREVLVLDEVYAVGDARFRGRCQERYRQLRQEGRTIVLVSHDAEAMALCDRAVLLEGGRIAASGPPGDVYRAYLESASRPPA